MNTPSADERPATVLVELTIAAPAETVWTALRDPAAINRWFGWDAPTLEEEIRFIFVDGARADEAAMRIRFEGIADVFEVEARGDAECVVRLCRHGAVGDESDWNGIHEDMTEGWLAFLTQLRFAVERHQGEERRTIYLSGMPGEGDVVLPRARLGFDTLAGLAPGERYSLPFGTGETLAGEVWRRSRRQIAVTVDGYGDGLVVVTDRSAENQPPAGGGSVIVTTYGMKDDEFREVEARWTALWQRFYPSGMTEACAGSGQAEPAAS